MFSVSRNLKLFLYHIYYVVLFMHVCVCVYIHICATSNCFCIIFYYAVLYLIIPPFYLVYIVFYIVSCPFILFIVFLFFLLSTMVKKNEGAKLSLFYYTRIILHLITSFQIMLLYFGHQSGLLHLLSFTIE